jgi:hypothetical protein
MELSFIIYILAALLCIPGIFFIFSYMRMYLAGGIASVGLLVLFIFFGIQYYNADGTYTSSIVSSSGPMPSKINMCPDFLSLYKDASDNYCVDTVGVSTSANNGLLKYIPNNAASSSSTPDATSGRFNLFLKDEDYASTTSGITDTSKCNPTTKDRKECLKQQSMYRGLTWAGFWNGAELLGTAEPPKPTA